MASTMASMSVPAIWRNCSTVPCSMKRSGRPMRLTVTSLSWSLIHSSMADPNPPARCASSTVTTRRNVDATLSRRSSSSGLQKRMS